MTEEPNQSNQTSAISEETVRKLIVDNSDSTTAQADNSSCSDKDSAPTAPLRDGAQETPVVRKLIVPDMIPKSLDPDDDRSPGLVDRTALEALKQAEDAPDAK